MAAIGIKDVMLAIVNQIKTLADYNSSIAYVRVWNNQLRNLSEQQMNVFSLPAAMVEVLNPNKYELIGQGAYSADIVIRIHLVQEFYSAADGSIDQDLTIYALRDHMVAGLDGFVPPNCTAMERDSEHQDYEHTNIYHYMIDWKVNFTDTIASPADADSGKIIQSTPPIALNITAQSKQLIDIDPNQVGMINPEEKQYIIPK